MGDVALLCEAALRERFAGPSSAVDIELASRPPFRVLAFAGVLSPPCLDGPVKPRCRDERSPPFGRASGMCNSPDAESAPSGRAPTDSRFLVALEGFVSSKRPSTTNPSPCRCRIEREGYAAAGNRAMMWVAERIR